MSSKSAIRNLQLITALDSLSYGLIYAFISPYILKLGGNHVHVGILAVGVILGELLSPEVTKLFSHLNGKRYALFLILNTSLVTHLLLVLTDSYWFTILVRILFSLTNQSQKLCLELLLNRAQNDDEKGKIRSNYSILSGLGFILGPIISGHLFDIGFGYIGVLAALLASINSGLLMNVANDNKDKNPEHTDKSVLQKAIGNVSERLQDLQKSNYNKHWDMLFMKYLFSSSVMIFFSKFSQILKHNYAASSMRIGYTASYINILVFSATYLTTVIKSKTQEYPEVFLSEIAFFFETIFLLFACYAPYYEMFVILLIPIIVIRSFLTDLWKELFSERKDNNLIKLNQSASIVAGLTTPVLFGFTCNVFAKEAVVLFSCVPILLCWIITRFYSKDLKIEETTSDKDK